MRGLKKTQIAGTVFTNVAAPSVNGSKRPMETPPSSPRGPKPGAAPSAGGLFFWGDRNEPLKPPEKKIQCFSEKEKKKRYRDQFRPVLVFSETRVHPQRSACYTD